MGKCFMILFMINAYFFRLFNLLMMIKMISVLFYKLVYHVLAVSYMYWSAEISLPEWSSPNDHSSWYHTFGYDWQV